MRLLTVTTKIKHCGQCCWVDDASGRWKCPKKRRVIKELWGDIPEWCPLEKEKDR